MKKSPADVLALSNHVFEKQSIVMPLWQTLADHFYPERADFTYARNVGSEVASGLINSYPILVRRDLANSFNSMLRDGRWFEMRSNNEPDHDGVKWLSWATDRYFSLLGDRQSNFVRSTKEADHDYAAFGNAVLSVQRNRKANGLLFQDWHLKHCAWWDDEAGQHSGTTRKWMTTYQDMVTYFGMDKVHSIVRDKVREKPFEEIEARHIVMPAEMYGDDGMTERFPFVSVWIDVKHGTLLEETPLVNKMYVVPRFQTISGSPYAYSPATMVGLPDARALQAMTHTLLEAGERYARPPIIATAQALRSDVDLSADGITYVDKEYDERMGAGLRTLDQNMSGFPIGLEMRDNCVAILNSAFYLDKISIPEVDREMTATEFAGRMKQYRRQALPLFAPIEADYNGQLCEIGFDIAMGSGFFGSPYDIPESLRDSGVEFKFKSPLSENEEEERGNRFQQVSIMLRDAAQIDPGVIDNVDLDTAFREATLGIGAPATWLVGDDVLEEKRQQREMQQMAAMAMESGVLNETQ